MKTSVTYRGKVVHTITPEDVGKTIIKYTACEACKSVKAIWLSAFMGRVQFIDIGKQIVEVSRGVYQVESQEQLHKRMNIE